MDADNAMEMEVDEIVTDQNPGDIAPVVNQGNAQNVQQNNDQNNASSNNDNTVNSTDNNTTIRDKCAYGLNCYRKNLQHKTRFSHPGDPDYDEVDNRPECPYGVQCYRKNPQHKRDYQHTRLRPRRQPNAPNVQFDVYFSSDEESVDESEYDPTELGMFDDDDDDIDDDEEIICDEDEPESNEDEE